MLEQPAQAIDDGKAESEAAAACAVGIAELAEFAEDILPLIVGNADAGVPHLDAQRLAAPPAADQDAAAIGITNGVGDEIEEDAPEQDAVALDPVPARQHPQAEPLLARRAGEG